jgi:hypothetical protein
MAGLLPNLRPVVDDSGSFLGDPRVLELLAKDLRFAALADQWSKSQTSGGDASSSPAPDFSALKGYQYGTTTADNRLPGGNDIRGSVSQHALYDPSGNTVTSMDYTSEGAGLSALKGVAGVLGAAFGLPKLYELMGGAAAGSGALDAGLLGAAPTYGEPLALSGTIAPEAIMSTAALPEIGGAVAGTGMLTADMLGAAQTMGEPLGYSGTLAAEAVPSLATAGIPALAGGGLLAGLPKVVTDVLGSKVGATLIGGLLGNALKPDTPTAGGGGGSGTGLLANPAPKKPAFKMPSWDYTSSGLPGGLGSKSAGLFDQYMRGVLGKG